MRTKLALLAAAAVTATATPAFAAPGDPIALGDDLSIDIQANVRARYEMVDQDNIADNADAVTVRARLGAELAFHGFKLLAEGEGTGAIVDNYNDTLTYNGAEPYPVVADPENIELNRLQLSYMQNGSGMTVGRQRINLGNQRFVGSVGWRQNEQTFDAVRGVVKLGVFTLDGTYAISQRTIFGTDSANEHFDGDLGFINATVDAGQFHFTGFAYLLDYDTRVAFSSQTWGLTGNTSAPVAPGLTLAASATFAAQSDLGANPTTYSANYLQGEVSATYSGFTLAASYEELGSDGGVAAFQTPLATGHAFQGWADLFLNTPVNGVRDYSVSLKRQFPVPAIGNVSAQVAYHEFDSDFGGIDYGSEWDASLGFRVGPINMMAKYANYNANAFGSDVQKFWLQAEWNY